MALYATPYPTMDIGGGTVEYKKESALGTPTGSYKFLRFDGDMTLPTQTRQSMEQPNLGHAVPFNKSDQPLAFEQYLESAFSIPQYVRMSATADGTPPAAEPFLGVALESCGAQVSYLSNDTTIAVYTSATSWTLTADVIDNAAGADTGGHCALVELDSGIYYPVLLSGYAFGTKTCTAAMGLPSASSATNVVEQMYTYTPRVRQVPTTKTLHFRVIRRGNRGWEFDGCAAASMGTLTFEPSKPLLVTPTFHVADIDEAAQTLAAETFHGRTGLQYANNSAGGFQVLYGNASASGAIANSAIEIISAEVDLGLSTLPIFGEGSTECLNGIQGYISSYSQATVTLNVLFHEDRISDFEASPSQPNNKFIGFAQPTSSLTSPAYCLYFPNCYLLEAPSCEPAKGNWIQATLKYGAVSAGYGSQTDEDDPEMAPWYFGISGRASA